MRRWAAVFVWNDWMPRAGRLYYDGWHYYLHVGPLKISYSPGGY